MSDPVFSGSDRVNQMSVPTELAQRLEGKSGTEALQITQQFYQQREQNVLANARAAIDAAKAGGTPPTTQPTTPTSKTTLPTKEQFWNDPTAAVRALQGGNLTKEEFNAATAPFIRSAVAMAERIAAEGKKHWNRFYDEVKYIMNQMSPADQADPSNWNVAYNSVLGKNYTLLEKEAVTAATTPASETVQADTQPEIKVDLTKLTFRGDPKKNALTVCDGLSITSDQYRAALKRIETGVFPGLTLDNRGSR